MEKAMDHQKAKSKKAASKNSKRCRAWNKVLLTDIRRRSSCLYDKQKKQNKALFTLKWHI